MYLFFNQLVQPMVKVFKIEGLAPEEKNVHTKVGYFVALVHLQDPK